ncbi:MAG: NUDIX hydrolase [Planctomycetes bacterium]|nr:NUDIX hydrolase [Planctomycetota bacterium]
MRREGSPPGEASDFYVLGAGDWVNVVALTPEDDLVLVTQWRHAAGRVTLEIPGGMVDTGETPREAAERELLEETGFAAPEWRPLGVIDPNPAILANRCHTFLALGARQVTTPHFDSNEECGLVLRPWAETPALVTSGVITHALVVVALHFEHLRRENREK